KKNMQKVRPIDKTAIRYEHLVTNSFINENDSLKKLCQKYGDRLSDRGSILGFGEQLSPIIFQYGCPNNAPGILWCKGNAAKKTSRPQLHNRSVHCSLFPLFHKKIAVADTAADRWIAKNHELAVGFLVNSNLFNERFDLLTILSYL